MCFPSNEPYSGFFYVKNDTNFNGNENCEKCRFLWERRKKFNELEHAIE